MLAGRRLGYFGGGPSHVDQDEGNDHQQDVLHRPVAQQHIGHRRPEILKRGCGERTQKYVENEAQKHLEVHAARQCHAQPVIQRRPFLFAKPTDKGPHDRHDGQDHNNPA